MRILNRVGIVTLALGLSACATIKSASEIKTWNDEQVKKSFAAGKDVNTRFLGKDFDDVYKKENQIKTVGILFVNLAWDDKAYREMAQKDIHAASFMTPTAAPDEHRKMADSVLEKIKTKLSSKGMTVLTPDQLAEKSQTFAAIKSNPNVFSFSPTFGQEFQGISATGSRYIDKWDREGELMSKIAKEAGIDAFVSFYMNEVGTAAYEAEIDGLVLYGTGGKGFTNLTMCVPHERAKSLGVPMGLFGKPNHCGLAEGDITAGRYLPSTKKTDHPRFAELKAVGFESATAIYNAYTDGMMTEFVQEAFD